MITMSILKNIHINENNRLVFFLNIFTIIILMLIYHPNDDIYTYGITIENKNKSESTLNIRFKRYLAEYEGETEIDKTGLNKNSPYYLENNGKSNYDEYLSIYENMKNRDSIKLKLYKTGYKHRYSKKKGLSKLDCYCEGKIFNRIDEIKKLEKIMTTNKNNLKKLLYKKYGLKIIISFLFPIIGLIVSALSLGKEGQYKDSILEQNTVPEEAAVSVCSLITIASFALLLVIIYILIKIIKYQKLKAGKGKMSVMEYCRFCNEILRRR
ncbi:Plasmodium exported protein, unknown function [Plasmodium vivax]|uniref:Variable surface protein n=1 Tax=Plasmodium vivax TaxID=5855 RepID=A0A565A431_PLAVI|nr:Plasmodium exported protein, unknown function [Plasmodium vivax]